MLYNILNNIIDLTIQYYFYCQMNPICDTNDYNFKSLQDNLLGKLTVFFKFNLRHVEVLGETKNLQDVK